MPAKMISDIPFPMPRSEICSPSHMMNAVPVVRVSTVIKTNPRPGLSANPLDWSVVAMPKDCTKARPMVRYRVHWVILRRPSSPSFWSFSRVGITTVSNWRMIDAVM